MASDGEICLFFVLADDETGASDAMKKAYSVTEEKGLKPKWMSTTGCLKLSKEYQYVFFICDNFDGPLLQKLNSRKCRIIGPMCIITCLERNMELPYLDSPVLLPTMVNLVICCTNVDKNVRNEVHRKVSLMGGVISRNLTTGVTHLVAGEVGSKKYHVAASGNIPIMVPNWVDQCWTKGQLETVHAKDECFDHLRCPVFLGAKVTVSQIDGKERQKIRELVEANGGKYSGHMKCDDTTHLVLQNPEGEKYTYARRWKLHCVNVSWVYDSVAKKYCQDESLYAVGSHDRQKANASSPAKIASTPICGHSNVNLESTVLMNCSVVSSQCAKPIEASEKCTVDETCLTSSNGYEKIVMNTARVAALKEDTVICVNALQQRNDSGHFLDGSKVMLMGLTGSNLDCVRKVVNTGGGIRYNNLNYEVTHVILGEMPPNLLKTLQDCGTRPHVVNLRWLVDSKAAGMPLEEAPYRLISYDKLNSVVSEEQYQQIPSGCHDSQTKKSTANVIDVPNIEDIMSQYEIEEDGATKPSKSTLEDMIAKVILDGNRTSQSVFKGLRFKVEGFGDEDVVVLVNAIETCGGSVEPSDTQDVISVVPVIGYDGAKGNKMAVTDCWLLSCAESSTLIVLKEQRVFLPIESKGNRPLTGCVFSLSHYKSYVKDSVILVGKHLGAKYEESLARFSNLKVGRLASTHLICAVAEGKKYEGALKWKLPIVTCDWLVDCAESGELRPESHFCPSPAPEKATVRTEVSEVHRATSSPIVANTETKELERSQNNAKRQRETPTLASIGLRALEVTVTPTGNRSMKPISLTPDLTTPKLAYEAWMTDAGANGELSAKINSDVKSRNSRTKRTLMNLMDESLPPPKRKLTSQGSFGVLTQKNVNGQLGFKLTHKFDTLTKKAVGLEENSTPKTVTLVPKETTEKVHKQMDDMLAAARIGRNKSNEDVLQNVCADIALDISEHRKAAPKPVQETSQVATVTWDDPASRMEREKLHKQLHHDSQIECDHEDNTPEVIEVKDDEQPIFMFSGLSTEDRKLYRKTVEDLGGTMSDSEEFNPACTHLVIGSLMRNEKLLGAIASGMWVLNKNYLVKCHEAGKLLHEEDFTWRPKDCSPGSRAEVLAKAATRWRLAIRDSQNTAGNKILPFNGWRAIVCTTEQRKKSISRLLKAGGAAVLDYKPRNTDLENVSHAFLESNQMQNAAVDICMLVANGVLCLPVEYIGIYLMEENPPPDSAYVIPQAKVRNT